MIFKHIFLGVIFMFVFLASEASAHELPGSSATVVVRDGHVTIHANLNIKSWMLAQKSKRLDVKVKSARKDAEKLSVLVNNKPVKMTLKRFPTTEQVHAILQQKSDDKHHPKLVNVIWEATRAIPNFDSVSVNFPVGVGDVLLSFFEPRSKIIKPGKKGTFRTWRPRKTAVRNSD